MPRTLSQPHFTENSQNHNAPRPPSSGTEHRIYVPPLISRAVVSCVSSVIWWIAIAFNFISRSGWGISSPMKCALRFSRYRTSYEVRYAKSISSSMFREADKLRNIGVIPDIPFFIRVAVAPFFCGEPEESHVEKIGFGCVHPVDLGRVELFRDQVLFDRVRMNPVIDLREVTPDIPSKLFSFLILESLEFLDEVEFEFH